MPEITPERYNKFIGNLMPGGKPFDFKDKSDNIFRHNMYMLNRTQSMFTWSGLPDSIPQRMVELYLQINGNVGFAEYNGTLYAFRGGLGGQPDEYYMPTIFTVANPYLHFDKNLKIGEEVAIIPNDSLYLGLMPMFEKYATLLAENELSIRIATINSRIIDLIDAPDDRTKTSAEKFLKDIEDGKLGVIAGNAFLDGIKAQPYGSGTRTGTITNLIELEQYLKAGWYNELGLNANYNMKRESLNSEESQLNNDALLPLIDDMLRCRQDGAKRVNDLFGTEISVEFNSAWEDNIKEIELEQEKLAAEGEEVQEDPYPENGPEENDPEEDETEGDEDGE